MITAAELSGLVLFESLTPAQIDELLAVGQEVAFVPGLDLWHEGEHADDWWVLLEGRIDLVRHVGREDIVFARLDAPGRWGGGFRAWDEGGVYLTTGRTATDGRVMRVPASGLRALAVSWFPFGVHIIDGVFYTVRNIEEGARQRGALVTLGTLAAGLAHELNNPAAASARAVDALEEANQGLLSALGELAMAGVSAQQYSDLDALRREIRVPDGPVDALTVADLEDELLGWLEDRGVQRAWEVAPALAAAGVDTQLVPAGPRRSGAGGTRPSHGLGDPNPDGQRSAGPGQGVHSTHLRAGDRSEVLLPDGPGLDAAHRRHRGPREHPGDARPPAARGRHHGGAGLRDRCRRSRRSPAS